MYRARRILYLDLENRESQIKVEPELTRFLGGLGQSLALVDLIPTARLVLSAGPLTGFLPFCSFVCCLFQLEDQWRSLYFGGLLGPALRLAGIDALVITGRSPQLLDIRIDQDRVKFSAYEESPPFVPSRSVVASSVALVDGAAVADGQIHLGAQVSHVLNDLGIGRLLIFGDKSYPLPDPDNYREVFMDLLGRVRDLQAVPGQNPSCFICPVGCEKSTSSFTNSFSALGSCLVSCPLADTIFSDTGLVFSCLEAVGEEISHEDIKEAVEFVDEVSG